MDDELPVSHEPIVLPNGETEKLKWYKRPKYVAAIAALLFAGAQLTVALTLLQISHTQQQNKQTLDQTAVIVNKIDTNQIGIDELVRFVRDVQAQLSVSTQGGVNQAVKDIETLLCLSDDPVRQQACVDLGLPTTVPGG